MHYTAQFSKHVLTAISAVKQYIDEHPLEKKDTEDLTSLAGINRNLLQKSFREIYGIKISEYQKQKRMEAAGQMLEDGRLSKKQIASRCGYSRFNNFCRPFRKVYKMTPGEWQNRVA